MDAAAELVKQNAALADRCAIVEPERDVPACPGWTMRNLLTHVGRGDRWAASIVAGRRQDRLEMRDVPDGRAPEEPEAALAWLRAGAQRLVDAAAATGDATVWTFIGPRPAAWWVRRRLHETVVHRLDAAEAAGQDEPVDPIEPAVAADAVDELLDILAVRGSFTEPPLAAGRSLALVARDADASWLVRADADAIVVDRGAQHGADVTLSGGALDLLRAVMRRTPADEPGVELAGDPAVWLYWRERTAF